MSEDILGCYNSGGVVPASTGWRPGRDAVKHPAVHRTAPQQRIIRPRMPIVMRLRNPLFDPHNMSVGKKNWGHGVLV